MYSQRKDFKDYNRRDIQHAAYCMLFEDRLYNAPLSTDNPPRFILDVGSGHGTWASDMADRFPTSEVIGVDSSPNDLKGIPPNVSFVLDDL